MSWLDIRQPRAVVRLTVLAFAFSVLFHAVAYFLMRGDGGKDDGLRLDLASQVEFGVTEPELGAEPAPAPAPPPAAKAATKQAPKVKAAPKPKTDDITIPADAGVHPDAGVAAAAAARAAAVSGTPEGVDGGEHAATSGSGLWAGADGTGGDGAGGEGNGMYAPAGATIALNVDLERVRSSSLLLEARALLGIIPEWEMLLMGSGIDPVNDLARVFVATPNLTRSSLVVSARATGARARIEGAVSQLASERGKPAPWRTEHGFPVAAWRNRGPTERVVALVGDDQLVITRAADLGRVLGVARALSKARAKEGFSKEELAHSGGLLAMQDDEAAALWVEGVRRYLPNAEVGVPAALRFSISRVDQYHTELRASGRYGSEAEAAAALAYIEGVRRDWSNNPRVIFLGLKNAFETAELEQSGAALVLRVQLTLHQTRYLLGYVSRALQPRDTP